jgi:hypothetical protein
LDKAPLTRLIAVAIAAWALAFSNTVIAQTTVAVAGGPASFDAGGTGNTFTVAGRATRSLRSWFSVELGVSYMPLDENVGSAPTRFGSADVQARLNAVLGRVSLSVGAGPSVVVYMTEAGGRRPVDFGTNAGPSIALKVSPNYGLVIDGRYRGWPLGGSGGTLTNGSVELTIGMSRRL